MNVHLHTGLAVVLAGAAMAGAAAAQAPPPQQQPPVITQEDLKRLVGEPVTETATIAAVDYEQRLVVLRGQDGKDQALYVGADVQRFSNVKVGDRVTFTYYQSLAVELLPPGEKGAPGLTLGAVGTAGNLPGGTVAAQSRIIATVESIDMANQSVTLSGEQGRRVIVKAASKDRIAKLKAGDRLEVTMTAAAVVSVEPAGK